MTGPFTEPTTGYWQDLLPAGTPLGGPPYRLGYPAALPCGRILVLPLRVLPDGRHAVASFIANHAGFAVVEAVVEHMARLAGGIAVELVVGMPTLGLALAPLVAQRLGHRRYVPLGYSRKFWYAEQLSTPVRSITSPDGAKRVYLDPNLRPLIAGRRVILVDDAVSSGATLMAGLALMDLADAEVAAVVVAMKQSARWREALAPFPDAPPVRAVFGGPLFERAGEGWTPVAGSMPALP